MTCSLSLRSCLPLLGLLTLFGTSAAAQSQGPQVAGKPVYSPEGRVYTFVEQMPELPGGGGSVAVVQAIQQHISYPPRAMRDKVEGRVFVGFTVAADGAVQNVAVVKSLRSDCDSVVMQAVKQLPRFEPGRQAGRAVAVQFTVPVTFRVQGPALPDARQPIFPDSTTHVYTFVEQMPVYPGGGGLTALTADLQREFQAASAAGGCVPPNFPVLVSLTVGPSGVIYDVRSVNNMPLLTDAAVVNGTTSGIAASQRKLPQIPAACEVALVAAARKLPRLQPGSQSGRRVAVNYTIKLVAAGK